MNKHPHLLSVYPQWCATVLRRLSLFRFLYCLWDWVWRVWKVMFILQHENTRIIRLQWLMSTLSSQSILRVLIFFTPYSRSQFWSTSPGLKVFVLFFFKKVSQLVSLFGAKHRTLILLDFLFLFFSILDGIHYNHVILAFKWFIKLSKVIGFSCPLGGFLSDAGWYSDAEKVFLSCLQLCTLHDEMLHWFRAVECCVR